MPPRSKQTASTKKHPVLFLRQTGDVEQGQLVAPELTLPSIQAHFKKLQMIEPIGTYPFKTYTLFLFGSFNGKEEQENKHQLPPPHDLTSFYGDIVLIASKDETSFANPIEFEVEEYEAFYTKAFGGYNSEDDEDELDIDLADIDECPVEEGKEFANDNEEEDEDEDEEDDKEKEDEIEIEEEAPRVKAKPKKRKVAKVSSSSILTGTASAYPDKPILSEEEQLQEEDVATAESPIESIRQQIIKGLKTIFKDQFSPKIIVQLEACIYNGSLKQARAHNIVRCWKYPLFVHTYKIHARHIASNFNPKSYVENNELFERFQQGEVNFQDIAKMDTYELFPSRWKEQFEAQQIREKRQLEGNRSMATDMFLCTRCHKRECTYYEMQTRSADEPMTIFITCLNCGKHWRQ
jgi:DNA-directed RNA polymerase subunit M/transcription elongation factor TFIIS